MNTWKKILPDSDFSIHNLPYGIFSTVRREPRIGIAIGDDIIDLAALHAMHVFEDFTLEPKVFLQSSLNSWISHGREITSGLRNFIKRELTDEKSVLREYPQVFVKQTNAQMHLPVECGDYTDFYSSREHAENVGKLFRDPSNALPANWLYLPVAYHGRSSSLIISGTDFRRPWGQFLDENRKPVFGPSRRLDFELEMAAVIGKNSPMGERISTKQASDYIFGWILLNDWSARDIQSWEYVPLGPFLGKNFATSISPWVVPGEALEIFKVKGPEPIIPYLDYLRFEGEENFDIELSANLKTSDDMEFPLCRTNSKYLYWNILQQIAHHTSNGCNLRIGDLLGTGTISGPGSKQWGSLLELTFGGKLPLRLNDKIERTYLEDLDRIIIRGHAKRDDIRVGFGEVIGTVLPASDSWN